MRVVAAVSHDLIACGVHVGFERGKAFCCLVARGDLIVIQKILCAVILGRKVGHHDVAAGIHALDAPVTVDGAKRGGRGKQNRRQHQPHNGQKLQRKPHRAGFFVLKRRIVMRDEGAHAHHLRLQVLYEAQVLDQRLRGLEGRAHHHAGTGLVAYFLEIAQVLHTVFQRQVCGMQFRIVAGIRRFVAQKIAVCPRGVELFKALSSALAKRQRDGAVRVGFANGTDDIHHALIGKVRVLAALQNEGAEAEVIAYLAALQDLFLGQAIALGIAVASANAAVQAIVFAVVGILDQSADIDLTGVVLFAHGSCTRMQIFLCVIVLHFNEKGKLLIGQVMLLFQFINQFICVHEFCPSGSLEKMVLVLTPRIMPSFPDRAEITSCGASMATLISAMPRF